LKIAKYGPDRIAAVVDQKLIDLNLAYASYAKHKMGATRPYALAGAIVPCDLLEFIKVGKPALAAAYAALEFAKDEGDAMRGPEGELAVFDLASTPLRAPLPSRASKLICMGRNFGKHAANAQAVRAATGVKEQVPESSLRPKRPAGFLKIPDTVRGPGEPIIYPSRTRKFDYEVELALIIGKQGKDIAEVDAMSYAWGYSIFCDYSARDQTTDLEDMQWVRHHKNFDCAAAIGPWIVTADEIPDPHNVPLKSMVNGQVRQDGNTNDMIYKFPRIIEYYSIDQTMYPGDVIASGTPDGTGMEKKDGSWFLQVGDTVEFEIPPIGKFSNPIVAKPPKQS
jgi:2-keto-4-pentenoate hydratase/2-oxohepta-3-ene-1,7-dioic acid hydratase in catechol pathway